MPEVLSPRALCTLEDVKRWMPGYDLADEGLDEEFIRLVNSESRSILMHTRRELAPPTPNPATRRFKITEDVVEERLLEIGDMATVAGLTVTLKQLDGTVSQVVPAASIVALPLDSERLETDPIDALEFPLGVDEPAALYAGLVADINATWGFPGGVPADVRMLTAARVVGRALMDVARISRQYSELVDETELRRTLNLGQRIVNRYRGVTLA